MPRYSDHHSSSTRLYVGHISSRTRTRDLEDLFSRYGRVRDVDMKRDYAFVDYSDPRDADDARYSLNGRDVDGSRIIVEFAKGGPRGPGGSRERDFGGRGPPPGSGRCFNCGIDGHWARDCKAGDWKNKCYRCGERGHIERNCQNSPKSLKRGRSYSRSPSPRRRSASPRRGRSRSRSRSFSRSRSYSQSRSPPKRHRAVERAGRSRSPRVERSRSPRVVRSSRSPLVDRSPRRLKSSPVSSRGRKRTPSPEEREPRGSRSLSPRDDEEKEPRGRRSPSPRDDKPANGSDYGGSPPRERNISPMDEAERESARNGDARSQSPYEDNGNGGYRSPSPKARKDRNGREDDDDDYQTSQPSPRGSD